jgi:hypothetical protein
LLPQCCKNDTKWYHGSVQPELNGVGCPRHADRPSGADTQLPDVQEAAARLAVELFVVRANAEGEFEAMSRARGRASEGDAVLRRRVDLGAFGGAIITRARRLAAADLAEAAVPGHDAQAVTLVSVLADPFVEAQRTFDIDARTLCTEN